MFERSLVLVLLALAAALPAAAVVAARLLVLAAQDDRQLVGVRGGATGVAGKCGVEISHEQTLSPASWRGEFLSKGFSPPSGSVSPPSAHTRSSDRSEGFTFGEHASTLANPHESALLNEEIPRVGARIPLRVERAADAPVPIGGPLFDDKGADRVVVAPRVAAGAPEPGHRVLLHHLIATSCAGRLRPTRVPALVPITAPSRTRAQCARMSWQAPVMGLSWVRLSAAAGQDVGARAGAPRAGPLRCLELAAADLGTAALALTETSDLDVLATFAFARHENSISIAISDREFLAINFLKLRNPRRKPASGVKNLQRRAVCVSGLPIARSRRVSRSSAGSRRASARCSPRSVRRARAACSRRVRDPIPRRTLRVLRRS